MRSLETQDIQDRLGWLRGLGAQCGFCMFEQNFDDNLQCAEFKAELYYDVAAHKQDTCCETCAASYFTHLIGWLRSQFAE